MNHIINITVQYWDDPQLDEPYLAHVQERRGIIETGKTLPDALRELAQSIECLEDYEKKPILGSPFAYLL